MKEELIGLLIREAPLLFPFGATNGFLLDWNPIIGGPEDYGPDLNPCEIRVEDGWFGLVLEMCRSLNKVLEGLEPQKRYRANVIKEKWGFLRTILKGPKLEKGTEPLDDTISALAEARVMSYETCEITGLPGRPCVKDKRYKVVCREMEINDGWRAVKPEEVQIYRDGCYYMWNEALSPDEQILKAKREGTVHAKKGELRKPADGLGMIRWLLMNGEGPFDVRIGNSEPITMALPEGEEPKGAKFNSVDGE